MQGSPPESKGVCHLTGGPGAFCSEPAVPRCSSSISPPPPSLGSWLLSGPILLKRRVGAQQPQNRPAPWSQSLGFDGPSLAHTLSPEPIALATGAGGAPTKQVWSTSSLELGWDLGPLPQRTATVLVPPPGTRAWGRPVSSDAGQPSRTVRRSAAAPRPRRAGEASECRRSTAAPSLTPGGGRGSRELGTAQEAFLGIPPRRNLGTAVERPTGLWLPPRAGGGVAAIPLTAMQDSRQSQASPGPLRFLASC